VDLKQLAERPDYAAIVDRAAEAAHEANRKYCASIGDMSQPSWADAPQWQKDSAVAGVLVLIGNPEAGPAALHESWMAQKLADGWVYGEVKDAEKKTHPCLVEYGALGPDQQFKDQLFHETVITSLVASMRQPAQAAPVELGDVAQPVMAVVDTGPVDATGAPIPQDGSHLDAPSAFVHPAADTSSGVTQNTQPEKVAGRVALIKKYGDKVPVQLKDDDHLARLIAEHGKGAVEVQS
jgi:hypothetical protein